ncbi:glycosyltransferase family 4 protein [Mariniflexile gromovii]|uniref:Glycosyltransferase family 4 protein n=1 Tax=Mariniflexile gromovii TaxID=362523 RepID=A0ABS4BTY0_9FLAO|nr:glycosyltransferase family 4 protein [Mariniflexile gromovii]MBP0904055.1 glycosyltransferase family 4 protein [Mariniflexile gromovii]
METHHLGLNIVGYTDSDFGLGEAVKSNIEAAKKHNIPLNIINYEKVKQDANYRYEFKYSINLVQIAINDLDTFFSVIDLDFFNNKYSILFLMWESEYFPSRFMGAINMFDEIWTASSYCKGIFEKIYNGPIIVIPHPVELCLKPITHQNSIVFFEKNRFSFLFIFNYHSSIERKNPFFLVEAFIKAFGNNGDVELIIKTVGSEQFEQSKRKLHQAILGQNNIKIFDIDLDKNSINHLINDCDCYVSMHHSEGFGLTLAEAMSLGKPTISINYSGNTEFMNEGNSFLVDYELGLIENPDRNFCFKTVWGNPNMQSAIKNLKEVYNNPDLRKEKAMNAKLFVNDKLSLYNVGSIIKGRLDHLYENFDKSIAKDKQSSYLLNQLQFAKKEIVQLQRQIRRMKKNVIISFILYLKDTVRKYKSKMAY